MFIISMNGFITESVSKLYDGFGTALYLLGLVFSTRLMHLFIIKYLGYPGLFIFSLLLLALGIFLLARGIVNVQDENKCATYGISAGVILWQVLQFLNLAEELGFYRVIPLIIWGIAALLLMIFWRKIGWVTFRFFSLVFLLMWAGSFLIKTSELIQGWTTGWTLVFYSVRMISLVGTLLFTWWIIFHSPTSMQRKISAVGLAFCAMLAGLWF
jgi:hypothetical protein